MLIKPDAVRKEAWLEIIDCYRKTVGAKVHLTKILNPMGSDLAQCFYTEHRGQDFYPRLIKFMTTGIVIALWLNGPVGTIEKVRWLTGATNPDLASPGTIRRLYGSQCPANAVHASATAADAARELSLIFGPCQKQKRR